MREVPARPQECRSASCELFLNAVSCLVRYNRRDSDLLRAATGDAFGQTQPPCSRSISIDVTNGA